MMLQISIVLLLCALLLSMYRSVYGPGLYNRLLAVNHFSLQSVMFIAIFGFSTGRPEFLDIAITYVLIGFIGAIAILKYHQYSYLSDQSEKHSKKNLMDGEGVTDCSPPTKETQGD